jgi:very-short-patch-repair endonuclease
MPLSSNQARKNSEVRWGSLQTRLPWTEVQHDIDINNLSYKELSKKYKMGRNCLSNYNKRGLINYHHTPTKRITSEKTKALLSQKRKQYLLDNPDKHPWKNHNKFISPPCEFFKKRLLEQNIKFLPEFTPLSDRAFAVDVCLPNKKIIVEINGQQHYNSDGTLKKYYQDRNDLLQADGWEVYEVHYSLVWNIPAIDAIIDKLINATLKIDFDFESYTKTKMEKSIKNKSTKPCIVCGSIKKSKRTLKCKNCYMDVLHKRKNSVRLNHRKVIRPSKEELEILIQTTPMEKIGKMFGVSGVAVRKWCKTYNIYLPNRRGFWAKNKMVPRGGIEPQTLLPAFKGTA